MASVAVPKLVPRVMREDDDSIDWVKIAAGGTLMAGALLLLTGNRKAGIAAAATGTALAVLDQQELIVSWWRQIPGYIDRAQHLIVQVQGAVEEMAAKREALRKALTLDE